MNSPAKSPLVTVTEVAADALKRPQKELPPISDVVDPDALNRFISSMNTQPGDVTVVFKYAELKVIVHSDGIVYATAVDDEDETVCNRLNLYI